MQDDDDDNGLADSRFLYSDTDHREELEYIRYGEIKLWVAPKEGKANTLLADQLFSPSLLIAEAIERGLLPVKSKTIVELGAGTALPSLLSACQRDAPTVATITDYPDELLMQNLKKNVDGNRHLFVPNCRIHCIGYRWGDDVAPLESVLEGDKGYDIVILSDLLHFRSSHDDLIKSLVNLLSKEAHARAYVGAGKYTSPEVCQNFLQQTQSLGIEWQVGENDGIWRGTTEVGMWTIDELKIRKSNVNWWIGKWTHPEPEAAR